LFAGLSKRVDLKLVSRLEFGSGVVGDAVRAEKLTGARRLGGPGGIILNRLLTLTSLIVLGACAGRAADSVASTCPLPHTDTAGWQRFDVADSTVSLLAPAGYARRAPPQRNYVSLSGPRSRFFLYRPVQDTSLAPGDRPISIAGWLPMGADTAGSDAAVVEAYSACLEATDRVGMLIELGLVSGGFGHLRRTPAIHVTWWTGRTGPLLALSGSAPDHAGQLELLAIARSVRFPAGLPWGR
jgi:hypothetical protein